MKFCSKILLIIILLLCFTVVCAPKTSAFDITDSFEYIAADTEKGAAVHTQVIKGENWLFLPSSADRTALVFNYDNSGEKDAVISTEYGSAVVSAGAETDMSSVFPGNDGIYKATMNIGNAAYKINIAFSANIRSMYITSSDPVKQGRAWVEKDKENKAKGNGLVLLSSDGEIIFDNEMKNMKGRGNSTWTYDKKPYQIKLKKAADLLENNEAADTWVLLANTCDGTMMRNSITYYLAKELDFAYTPNNEYVDLYYDGEYRGTYLLCEKTEIGKNRIEIANLESAVADVNTEDVETLGTATARNIYGNKFQYVKGAEAPDDVSGGYLLEMDYPDRAAEEVSWFTLDDGEYVVVKSPEYAPYEAVKYISEYFQGFVNAVNNGGTDPYTGKKISDYVDFDSLIQFITIQELTKNGDSFGSSTYFYKDAGENIMYAGPLWDFDSCYGGFIAPQLQKADGSMFGLDSVYRETNLGTRLLKISEVKAAVREYYFNTFAPAVKNIMLGDAGTAGSIRYYEQELYSSQRMNFVLWPEHMFGGKVAAWNVEGYGEYVNWLENFIRARMNWFDGVMSVMEIDPCTELKVEAAPPADEEDAGSVKLIDEYKSYASVEDYLWTVNEDGSRALEFTFTKKKGMTFTDDFIVTVNDGECSIETDETGTVKASINFEKTADQEIPFIDVDINNWYYNAIADVYEQGIFNGVSADIFVPDADFSRAMLVSVLWRMEGRPESVENPFTDIQDDAWYRDAASWAYENGIVYGMGNDTFAGNEAVTREQLMCVLVRYAEYKGTALKSEESVDFSDMDSVSDWAADNIRSAINSGLFGFAGSKILNAGAAANRAQVAWVITRFLALIK